jgi:hypothetical protein
VSLVRSPTSVLSLVSLCAQSYHFDMYHSSLLRFCYFSHLSIPVTDMWDPLFVWVPTVRPLSPTSFPGNPNQIEQCLLTPSHLGALNIRSDHSSSFPSSILHFSLITRPIFNYVILSTIQALNIPLHEPGYKSTKFHE